jgi:predicted amidohydrolase YtcJ
MSSCPSIIRRVGAFCKRAGRPALGGAIGLLLAGGSGRLAIAQPPAAGSADLLLFNGRIFTADSLHPWVEALAIRADRVVGLGLLRDLERLTDAHTRRIDLGGRMAMPGINDVHDHAGGAPFGVLAPTATAAMDDPPLTEIADAVARVARRAPAGQWIRVEVGPSVISRPREARAMLDRAAAGHPAILIAWWGHGVVLNGAGMATLQLDDRVVDPPGGRFDRDEQGHLTGLAEEYAGAAIRRRLFALGGVSAMIGPMQAYARRRIAEGVTTTQIMSTEAPLADYRALLTGTAMPLRVRLMRYVLPALDGDPADHGGFGTEVLSPCVRIDGIKWVLDGTPIEQLAYRSREYPGRPGWRGRANFAPAFIERQLRLALTGRDPLILHVVGDRMTDELLSAMEQMAPADQWRRLRVRVEHGNGLADPRLAARAARLGVIVGQPRPGIPFKRLADAGLLLAYGSDGGLPPFVFLASLTNPRDPQALTREQGLLVLTRNGAVAEGAEREKGTLAVGMLADVIVLSRDVMRATDDALAGTRSVLTLVGGRVVHDSSNPRSRIDALRW